MIESRVSWDYNFILRDQEVIGELQFWKHEISALNLKCFSEYKVPSIIVYSDASSFACGAYSCQLDNQIFHKMWTGGEKELSSTWRELKAIELCIDTFQGQLSGKVLKWFTDSQNCVGIVESGSGKPQLHSLAMSIFSICVKNSINIDIEWIPRGKNIKADAISKIFDFDDWGVSLEFFEFIDSMYGPHSVDRFADSNNKKIELFNSRFYTPGSSGVDAFSFDWKEDNNWLVPPIHLVCRVIKHCIACKASGTLIVPKWESAPFWPLLYQNKLLCQPYVADMLEFKDTKDIYIHGSNKKSLFGSDEFKGTVLAVRIVT